MPATRSPRNVDDVTERLSEKSTRHECADHLHGTIRWHGDVGRCTRFGREFRHDPAPLAPVDVRP